ncbi:hypothetical protein ES703_81695 [subsurface metagenome]
MKDPIELPGNDVHRFACTNIITGHIRNVKVMTSAHALLMNTYNHNKESGYMWLWDDQFNFDDQLDYDSAIVIKA